MPFRLIVIFALALSNAAFAEQSADSTGDFWTDLGQVYGAATTFRNYKDICAELFAEYKKPNDDAYAAWRAKNLKFLQEIEKYRLAAAWKEAKGDQKKYVSGLAEWDAGMDGYKDVVRKQFKSAGREQSQRICSQQYPRLLLSDQANLEYFYAEQVATIRRGPQGK